MSMKNPLVEISEAVATHAKTEKVAVIFDLDSTLFCVSTRTQAILRDLGQQKEFAERFSAASEILKNVEVLPTDWGIRTVLIRHQVEGGLELFEAVRNFWRKHFFGNQYLDRDEIYPSAVEYVTHLHKLGADILYLTGRNQGAMQEGTVRILRQWGFPFFADSKLYMKPNEVETDEGYKAKVLQTLVQQYDHIWFFENEPVIINQVRSLVPKVKIVFVNSVHSGLAEAPTDLPTIGMSYQRSE